MKTGSSQAWSLKAGLSNISAVLAGCLTAGLFGSSALAQRWEQAATLPASGEPLLYRQCVDRDSFKLNASGLTEFNWTPVRGANPEGCAKPPGRVSKFAVRCSQNFAGPILVSEWKTDRWVENTHNRNELFHRISAYVCRK